MQRIPRALGSILIAFQSLIGLAPQVLACASCGSGGEDPLILYPNEGRKAYAAWSRAAGFRNIEPNGAQATAGGPSTKDSLVAAVGQRLSLRSFATLTLPFLRNARGSDSRSSLGDPILAARYTLVMANLADPWVPQVQLVASFKQALARSLRESHEPTLIDVFGSGFSEARAGVDLWYGEGAVKFGGAQSVIVPLARRFDGERYQPGLGSRGTLTLGYSWIDAAKTLVGINRDQRAALSLEGEELTDSEQVSTSVFLTQDYRPDEDQMLRLTWSRQAALGENRNTARSNTITLAYMRRIDH